MKLGFKSIYKKWIWPEITDLNSAKRAALAGVWAFIYMAIVNIVAIIIKFSDKSSLVDVALCIIFAWCIFKISRVAAVIGLIYYMASKIFQWASYHAGYHARPDLVVFIIIFFLINSIRGTFSYHKFLKEAKETLPPEERLKKLIPLKHSLLGKIAVLIALGIVLSQIITSISEKGTKLAEISATVGFIGGFFGSIIGVLLSIIGLFHKNRKKLLPILGLILNSIILYFIIRTFNKAFL